MAKIASRVSQLTGEGALAVFSRAKELEKDGRSIIHLELGEPDFHPAAPVVDARARGRGRRARSIRVHARHSCAARSDRGIFEADAALDVAPEQVLVAPGCKMALSLAMMALIEPGDEVLYPDPSFPIYPSFTRGLGATAVSFALREENKFQPDLKEIAAKITSQNAGADFQFTEQSDGNSFQRRDASKNCGAGREARSLGYFGRNLRADFVQRRIRIDLVVAGNGGAHRHH